MTMPSVYSVSLPYIIHFCLLVFQSRQKENEVRRIASVSSDAWPSSCGLTIILTEPLTYTHLGVSVTLPDGTVFEGRADVGLLTRNMVVRGSKNPKWNDQIEACPEGSDTGTVVCETSMNRKSKGWAGWIPGNVFMDRHFYIQQNQIK